MITVAKRRFQQRQSTGEQAADAAEPRCESGDRSDRREATIVGQSADGSLSNGNQLASKPLRDSARTDSDFSNTP
jgi:hypothetical protein